LFVEERRAPRAADAACIAGVAVCSSGHIWCNERAGRCSRDGTNVHFGRRDAAAVARPGGLRHSVSRPLQLASRAYHLGSFSQPQAPFPIPPCHFHCIHTYSKLVTWASSDVAFMSWCYWLLRVHKGDEPNWRRRGESNSLSRGTRLGVGEWSPALENWPIGMTTTPTFRVSDSLR